MTDLNSRTATIEQKIERAKKLANRPINPILPFGSRDDLRFNPPIKLEELIAIENRDCEASHRIAKYNRAEL